MNAPKWNLIYDKTFDDSAHSHDFFSRENVIHLWMGKACPGVLYQKDKLFSLKKYYAKILMGNPRKIWIVAKTILALEEEAEEEK